MDRVLCSEGLPYLLGDAEEGLSELARISKREVIFSLHTEGVYEIKGTPIEIRGNIVEEKKPGFKPPRRFFEWEEIVKMVESIGSLKITTILPFLWENLCQIPDGAPWPWYLPPQERIALFIIFEEKTKSEI